MTFRIYDRVKETSTTTGTGTIILNGALGAFQSFNDAFLDGQTTYYTIENGSRWEVGQGVFDQTSNSISRDIVFDSSNNNNKIDLEGVSIVFCTLPASKAFIKDPNDQVVVADLVALSEINVSGLTTNNIFNSGDYNAIGDLTLGGDITVSGNAVVAGGLEIGDILTNNIVASGEIISSGFLTLIRNGEGNFFHAYKDDGIKQTVSLHVDSAISPLWKLGLKPNPSDETSPPTFAYIFGRDGQIGLLSNNQNFFSLGDSYGFSVTNESHVIFSASSDTGAAIDGLYPNETVLRVQGSPLQVENLQDWEDSASNVLSVVDSGGKFGILNDSPDYDLDVNGSGRMESIYLTSGVYFQDGTFQSSASTGGGTGDAVEVSGWADVTMTNRDNAVSGYFQTYVDSQDHSAAAVSGWADFTMSERDAAVSGWTDTSLVNLSGWANTTIINGDNAVSGWADQTFDLQGVTDRGNNTTNSIFTGGNFFASGDITATSGQLSGINFTPLVEADHPGYVEGRVFYDAENHCVTVYNDESEISLQVGQEEYIRVRNVTGSTISNGSPVYITGAQGQHTTVDLSTATEELKSEAVGIATHDIENNSFGYITTFGLVRGINTTAFTEGDELFVSVTDGELTNTSPIAPNYKTSVGHVVVAGVNGSILVTPRDHKLGGGDAKTLGNIAQSGIVFFESITNGGDAGILASDPNFYFDQPNSRVQLDTGGLRFDDGTTQTTAASNPAGDPSGVNFFGDDGTLSSQVNELVYNSGTNQLLIGHDDWDKTKGAYADTDLITASGTIRATGLTINTGSRTFKFSSNNFFMGGTAENFVTTYTNIIVGGLCIGSTYTSVVVGAVDQTTYDAKFRIFGDDPTEPTSMVTAATLQTAPLQEWQDSAETPVARVQPSGMFDNFIAESGTDEFRIRFGDSRKEIATGSRPYITGVWLDFEDGTEYYDSNNGMIFGTWYNSTKTARSWMQISRNNFRVEIGNGLRMITSATATRFNGDVYPYTSTPRELGKEYTPWGTGWFRDLSVSGVLRASGDPGSAGQVLTSTGSSVYWSTPAVGGNRTYNNITADFSMSDDSDVVFMDTSSGPINVYLPTALGQGGKEIMVKLKAGANSGVLQGSGSQTIDGNSVFPVYNTYESINLISDNSNWLIN